MNRERHAAPFVFAAAIIFLLLSAVPLAGSAVAYPGTIDVSEIRPGMTGYGLSVFKGGRPVRFEVEVIDVLPNALTRQDLILVRCSGQDLEKTMIVAGMSGSPVYLEGRLAGAVAYGWSFSREPLAGVTPIKYMIDAMNRPRPRMPGSSANAMAWRNNRAWPTNPAGATSPAAGVLTRASDLALPGSVSRAARMTPIATPVLAAGFTPAGLDLLASELAPFNMIPVAAGGISSLKLDKSAIASMVPGAAIGAVLVSGDLSMTAIGTLTWRDGDKIVAFGHPFMQGGPVSMPLVSARIHAVVNTQATSFKLGSPTAAIGEMTGDQQAGITGVLGRDPPVVHMKIKVSRKSTGFHDEYNLDLVKQPAITPLLIRIGLMEVIKAAAPALEPATVRAKTRLKLSRYGEVEYKDFYAVRRNNFSMGFLDPVMFFARNPFEQVEVEDMDVDLEVTDELKLAVIESVWTDTDEVEPGTTVELGVVVRPYNEDPVEYRFKLPVPDDERLKRLSIKIAGGNNAVPDVAMPRSVPDMIALMKAVYPADHLVVNYSVPGRAMDVKGQRLHRLPPSITSVLQPKNSTGTAPAPELVYLSRKTPYVIVGAKRLSLKVNATKRNNHKKR